MILIFRVLFCYFSTSYQTHYMSSTKNKKNFQFHIFFFPAMNYIFYRFFCGTNCGIAYAILSSSKINNYVFFFLFSSNTKFLFYCCMLCGYLSRWQIAIILSQQFCFLHLLWDPTLLLTFFLKKKKIEYKGRWWRTKLITFSPLVLTEISFMMNKNKNRNNNK